MGIKWMIRKSDYAEIRKSLNKEADNKKLEALKKEVIAILEKKDKQEYKKAIEYFDQDELRYSHLEKSVSGEWIEKAGYGVGTVRIWKGKKYKKVSASPVRWVRVFDKNDRGAASSMGKYIAQVKKCNSVEELYQFCMKQRSLFQDENGVDLPIMDKLKAAIDEQSGKIERGEVNKPTEKKKSENKTKESPKATVTDSQTTERVISEYLGDKKNVGDRIREGNKEIVFGNDYTKKHKLEFKVHMSGAFLGKPKMDQALFDELSKYDQGADTNELSKKYGIDGAEVLGLISKVNEGRVDIVGNNKESEDNHYWIQDSKGNRLTNESAKKRIKASYDEIDKIKDKIDSMDKADKVHAELDIRKLQHDINNLMDKLTSDDRKEMESEAEKHQNRSDAMKGNKNAYKGGFEDTPIAKAVEKYASDKQIKSTVDKVSSESFASTDPYRMFMNGTFHEDGYKIATDGHVLSMIKSDYPADDEGKIKATPKAIKEIDKGIKKLNETLTERENILNQEAKAGTGTNRYKLAQERVDEVKKEIANAEKSKESGIIDAKFPNYKKVIPSIAGDDIEPAKGFEDFNKILKVAKVAAAYNKAKKEKASVKVGDYNFDPNLLINAVAMAEKHGLKNVNFRPNSYNPAQSPIEFSGDNGYVVIMPMGNDSGRTTFDAATGNVNGNMTTSGRYVADDIKDFLGADGNSNKEETEEDKLKAETKAEKESRTASQETKEKLYEDIPSGVTEQNYKKYIDMGTKLYTKWGYDMNDPRQQKQLKGQINDIVQQINNKDFDILESLENSSNIFTRTIWMMQTGGVSPDKAGVEKYFGKDATEKHNKELEEKKAIYEQKKAEDEKRRLTDKVRRTFDKEHINYGKLSSPEARETFINYLSSLPPNRQESALNRLSKDMIRYKKDGKEKVSFMLDYIIDQIDDGTSIDTIKASYRDVRSKPIVSFAQWYADSKIGVTKSVLFNDFDEIIEVYEDTDFEDESYSDYDASQPDLFNSTSYKVGAALDSIFGC